MTCFGQTDPEGRHYLTRSRLTLRRDCGDSAAVLVDRICCDLLDRRELQRHRKRHCITVERLRVTFCEEPECGYGFAKGWEPRRGVSPKKLSTR
jgi:hypothetical protein